MRAAGTLLGCGLWRVGCGPLECRGVPVFVVADEFGGVVPFDARQCPQRQQTLPRLSTMNHGLRSCM